MSSIHLNIMQKLSIKALITTTICLLLIGNAAKAQQDPYYAHFMFNKLTYNPAYASNNMQDHVCATVVYKNQWFGWLGTPTTSNFNVAANFGSNGYGLNVEQDQLGFQKGINFSLSYSRKIELANQAALSIGASAGLIQKALDGTKLRTLTDLQKIASGTDPSIPTTDATQSKPDLGFGLYYTKQSFMGLDNFYGGLSATHLLPGKLTYATGGSINLRTHAQLIAGGDIQMGANVLQPNIKFRTDLTKTQFEINANYYINNQYWGGVSYRWDSYKILYRSDAVILMAGWKPNPKLKFGISYDITVSRLGQFTNSFGTVELMAQYCFKLDFKSPPTKKYYDTRRTNGWQR